MDPESKVKTFGVYYVMSKKKTKSIYDLLSYYAHAGNSIPFGHIHKSYGIYEVRLKLGALCKKK